MLKTPKELGYYFPAEWEQHEATWLSFPHNLNTWSSLKMENVYPSYFQFIRELANVEIVRLNVLDDKMKNWITGQLQKREVNLKNVEFFIHPTNDAWCRDHGPAFLINPQAKHKKIIIDWEYNAWGGKYLPYADDNQIPHRIAQMLQLPIYKPNVVMEGGSVDFNGKGTVLTTTSCLLNDNRNPHLTKRQIEWYLSDYFGVTKVIWLAEGIEGDDTDGHIDDITRFVNEDTVITMVEGDTNDPNYQTLNTNLQTLKQARLQNDKPLNIIEIPMPSRFYTDDVHLPASYANFYIANGIVIVPVFACKEDDIALNILEQCFPDRKVIGIDSREIIWGLGSFHCLSQQEPAV